MTGQMRVSVHSHLGNSRDSQQDCWLVMTAQERALGRQAFWAPVSSSGFVAAVSDGMGGHACGDVASRLVCEYLAGRFGSLTERAAIGKEALVAEFIALNRAVLDYTQANPACQTMGATLSGIVSGGGKLLGFHVGDSRIYRFSGGCLQRLTKDHTEGQRMVNMGLIAPEEIKTLAHGKSLYKYIGRKNDLMADLFEIGPCAAGDILLICTDGLSDAVPEDTLRNLLSGPEDLQEKGKRLLDTALGEHIGYGDNITILLIEF